MKEIDNEVHIDATAEQVWHLLTDFVNFPQWNPFMQRVTGEPKIGTRLQVTEQPSGTQGRTLRPTVSCVDSQRELRWHTKWFISGLLDRERIFIIEPLDPTHVRFTQREVFTGLLASLRGESRNVAARRGLREMNQALKLRAEQGQPAD